MKGVIMQPYIFPYLGYFQLINETEIFVFYDNVNFIKKGWINRNRILLENKEFMFSIPIKQMSQNRLISETKIDVNAYENWKIKFLQTLCQSYKKAPNFESIYQIVLEILELGSDNITDLTIRSIKAISDYLNLETVFIKSSSLDINESLKGEDRIIQICKQLNIQDYINPIGGKVLYRKENFTRNGINLNFLNPNFQDYNQYNNEFIKGLSIIDVLMFNDAIGLKNLLKQYNLE